MGTEPATSHEATCLMRLSCSMNQGVRLWAPLWDVPNCKALEVLLMRPSHWNEYRILRQDGRPARTVSTILYLEGLEIQNVIVGRRVRILQFLRGSTTLQRGYGPYTLLGLQYDILGYTRLYYTILYYTMLYYTIWPQFDGSFWSLRLGRPHDAGRQPHLPANLL